MKFPDLNAADEGACDYTIVEVYYENDVPHSWCEYFSPRIDNLDLPEGYTEKDVIAYLSKAYLDHIARVQAALAKPILDSTQFETPSEK